MGDYAFHLSHSLCRQGHQILIVTQGPASVMPNAGDIEILSWPGKWNFQAGTFIEKALRAWKPDLLHLQYMTTTFQNSSYINFLPFLLKRNFPQIKKVTTYHEFAAPWGRLALLPLLLASDAHIVTNERHFDFLKKMAKIFWIRKPLVRIPLAANVLPVDLSEACRLRVRQELGVKPEEILLVRFGILHDISLPLVLRVLKAFSRMRKEGIPVKLLLIGKGEARAVVCLKEKIKEADVCDAVILKTDLSPEKISGCLNASDIGLALYEDGVSEKRTAFLAVLAHGLPVLATRRGNLPSELREGDNIVCVPVGETEDGWASAIKKLIEDESLRRHLASEGKEVAAQHDWNEIGRRTSLLYQEIGREIR